jgi:hypothetical protein
VLAQILTFPVSSLLYHPDGLTSANLIASTATHSGAANRGGKRGGRGGKKGDSRGRKVRIQNTHLEGVDLSKDYTAQ